MDAIYKCLIYLLGDDIIYNFIRNRNLTFKNAQMNILLSNPNYNLYIIICKMITNDNSFLYEHDLCKKGICCINPTHKDPLAQQFYYKILVNDNSKFYCNNCIDAMIRFSKKMVVKLGNIHYKKMRKLYFLIRKSSLYYLLVEDCFNNIFDLCLRYN